MYEPLIAEYGYMMLVVQVSGLILSSIDHFWCVTVITKDLLF